MAFDEQSGTVVLFGGIDRDDYSLNDTWQFDGDSWQKIKGRGPSPRRYAALAYDPQLKGCLLHGGSEDDAGTRKFGDAWLFRNGAWARLPEIFDTDKRDDHGLAYHRSANTLVMLEGVSGARGVLARGPNGWYKINADPLHPRHQCSPLAWSDELSGLVFHGGEEYHMGPQFDTTWLLRLPDLSQVK
jgi:hypothetical protein